MGNIISIKRLDKHVQKFLGYSLYLNEIRKNLAANLERSSLTHSYGYESVDDRPTLFARFSLISFPSCNMQA